MNSEIKTILNDLKVDGIDIPVAHLRYKGDKKTYVTWQIISEQPSLMANDEYLYSVVSIYVHIFSDKNYTNLLEEVKKRFIANDWVWSETSTEMYEDDTKLYHRVITFEKEKEF